jgi:hypothetical protein
MNLYAKFLATGTLLAALASAALAQTATAPAARSLDNSSWLSPAEKMDTYLPHWLQFHGEERVRAEGTVGAGFKPAADDGYLLNRFRFDMQVRPASWLKFDFQVQDAQAFWKNQKPYAPPYQDTWDLRMAYVELGNLEKYHATFRAGRQELAFGDERLIGISNWTNVARTFDGYRTTLQYSRFRLDAFTASVVTLQDGEVGQHTPGNYLHGLYGQITNIVPNSTIQPYFLWRRSPNQKLENGKVATSDFGTTGVRWVGQLPLGFAYNSEVAMQRGSLGTDRLAAWASHLALSYKLPVKLLGQTRYIGEYNFASGDGNSKDGIHGTFDQLYASGHDKLDLADQVGWKNIQNIRAGVDVKFKPKWSVSIRYNDYWLADAHDALYNSSGTLVARRINGSAGRWVGQEFDGTTIYNINRISQIGAGYGYLLPGTFLQLTTPGHSYSFPYLFYSTAF